MELVEEERLEGRAASGSRRSSEIDGGAPVDPPARGNEGACSRTADSASGVSRCEQAVTRLLTLGDRRPASGVQVEFREKIEMARAAEQRKNIAGIAIR